MPWNGSGTYSPPVATFPEVNGTTIDAGRFNPTILDLATGITAALAKNGENAPSANLPMGGFKHTGAGSATALGQYLTYGQTAGYLSALGILTTTPDAILGISTSGGSSGFRVHYDRGTFANVFSGINNLGDSGGFELTSINSSVDRSFNFTSGTSYAARSNKFSITSDGRVYGVFLHNNAGAVTGTTNQYIASGTYTPTFTNVSNIAVSSATKAQWIRVGNVVCVSGKAAIDPTSAGANTELGISLPIASNLAGTTDLAGTAATSQGGGSPSVAEVHADVTNDRASLLFPGGFTTTTSLDWFYIFQYEVK